MTALEETRELHGATSQDENGRFFAFFDNGVRKYGYKTWLTGAFVCYTCGHLCDCGEDD